MLFGREKAHNLILISLSLYILFLSLYIVNYI